jgi:hypothetical protein
MTLDIRHIWNSVNKILTVINVLLFGLILLRPFDYQKAKATKLPVALNIVLLLILVFIVFAMTYGAYRRATDL